MMQKCAQVLPPFAQMAFSPLSRQGSQNKKCEHPTLLCPGSPWAHGSTSTLRSNGYSVGAPVRDWSALQASVGAVPPSAKRTGGAVKLRSR